MFLLAVLLLLASAANAAAVGPRNATYDTTYDTTLTHFTAALNPPKLDSGPHWPHPSHKVGISSPVLWSRKMGLLILGDKTDRLTAM